MSSEESTPFSSPTPKRLLVVDDEESIRKLFLLLFRPPRFETCVAANGIEALRFAREGRFDLVFMDILMPGTSGLEICKQLRQTQPDLKIVLVSGYMRETPVEAIEEARAECLLEKPFEVASPLKIVDKLLFDEKAA